VLKEDEISLDEQRDMLRWLYVANYRGHYSASSETTLDADLGVLFRGGSFKELLEPLLTKFGRLHVEAGDFRGRGERSPLFSIAYLALKNAGAADWITGLGLSLRHQGQLHYIEYHHIFPKSLLRETYEKAEINEIANMAFISSKANREISNKEPTKYLPTIILKRGKEALSNQVITLDKELWELDRFRDFLENRRAALAAAVNRFVEASVAEGKAAAIEGGPMRDTASGQEGVS